MKRRKNPLREDRVSREVVETPTWSDVSQCAPMGFIGKAVEVLRSDDEGSGEVAVYLADPSKLDAETRNDLIGNLDRNFEWTKEHAELVVRGQVGDLDATCISHRAASGSSALLPCNGQCLVSVALGWHGVLEALLFQNEGMGYAAVVVDREPPKPMGEVLMETTAQNARDAYGAMLDEAYDFREIAAEGGAIRHTLKAYVATMTKNLLAGKLTVLRYLGDGLNPPQIATQDLLPGAATDQWRAILATFQQRLKKGMRGDLTPKAESALYRKFSAAVAYELEHRSRDIRTGLGFEDDPEIKRGPVGRFAHPDAYLTFGVLDVQTRVEEVLNDDTYALVDGQLDATDESILSSALYFKGIHWSPVDPGNVNFSIDCISQMQLTVKMEALEAAVSSMLVEWPRKNPTENPRERAYTCCGGTYTCCGGDEKSHSWRAGRGRDKSPALRGQDGHLARRDHRESCPRLAKRAAAAELYETMAKRRDALRKAIKIATPTTGAVWEEHEKTYYRPGDENKVHFGLHYTYLASLHTRVTQTFAWVEMEGLEDPVVRIQPDRLEHGISKRAVRSDANAVIYAFKRILSEAK